MPKSLAVKVLDAHEAVMNSGYVKAYDELERVLNLGLPLAKLSRYVRSYTDEGREKLLETLDTLGYALIALDNFPECRSTQPFTVVNEYPGSKYRAGDVVDSWGHLWDKITELRIEPTPKPAKPVAADSEPVAAIVALLDSNPWDAESNG